jgi:hypothetical protein
VSRQNLWGEKEKLTPEEFINPEFINMTRQNLWGRKSKAGGVLTCQCKIYEKKKKATTGFKKEEKNIRCRFGWRGWARCTGGWVKRGRVTKIL